MAQLSNIAQGWFKYLTGTVTETEKARAEICKNCAFAKVGMFEEWLPESGLKEVKGLKCSKCTCPLVAKIRSKDEECPIKKW